MLRHATRVHVDASITHTWRQQLQHVKSSFRLLQSNRTNWYPAGGSRCGFASRTARNKTRAGESKDTIHRRDLNLLQENLKHLHKAIVDKDATNFRRYWETLNSSNLASLGPSHYDEPSKEIASVHADSCIPTELKSCVRELEEAACIAAVHGFPRGLLSMVHAHLLSMEPDDVDRIYSRFRAVFKKERKSTKETSKISNEEEAVDVFVTLPETHSLPRELDEEPTAPSEKLELEMLLYAIAGAAIRWDFLLAVRFITQAKCPILRGPIRPFISRLGPDFPPIPRIQIFLKRAIVASLLARPDVLLIHMRTLIHTHSTVTLQATCEEIIEGLSGSNPWLTLDPATISTKTPFAVTPYMVCLFLFAFLKTGKLDLAEKLWDDMTALGITSNIAAWRALISGYMHLRMPDQVTHAWNAMLEQGHKPDYTSYRLIITALLQCGSVEPALEHLSTFQRKLDQRQLLASDDEVRSVYNVVIRPLTLRKRVDVALALVQRMETVGPKPTIRTLDPLLAYYSETKDLKGFAVILQKISTLGLVPSEYTYSSFLTAMLPVRKDAVPAVFNMMQKHGRQPDRSIYTTVIDVLMAEQTIVAFQTALQILQDMETSKHADMRPNEVTYTCILTGMLRGGWMKADMIKEYTTLISRRMEKQRLMHSLVSYHILIKACFENPEPEGVQMVKRYYREMRRRRITLMPDTWYILISGLVRRLEWGTADLVVDDLLKSNTSIPPSLANLLTRVSERRPYTTHAIPRRTRIHDRLRTK